MLSVYQELLDARMAELKARYVAEQDADFVAFMQRYMTSGEAVRLWLGFDTAGSDESFWEDEDDDGR